MRNICTYKVTAADAKIRRKVKAERGSVCESCQVKLDLEKLHVHHILETRLYPELAREPLNMIVLCQSCHQEITDAERFATSLIMNFYSQLRSEIRQRHVPFLESVSDRSKLLPQVFREGGSDKWNAAAIRDITR